MISKDTNIVFSFYHQDNVAWNRQQQLAKKKGDALHKRLKSKLFSLEFGENAGASSSMMENKTKVLEKMLDELHRGNFNPSVRSGLITPDSDAGTQLEMSCIPYEGSPFNRRRLGTNASDSVFIDTPEVTKAGSQPFNLSRFSHSVTQKFTFSKQVFNESLDFATVHSFMKDINLIASCQAYMPVQYSSNIEVIRQK